MVEYQKGNFGKAIKGWKKVANNNAIEENVRGKAYLGMGFAYTKSDNLKEAISSLRSALGLFQRVNDKKSQAETLGVLGGIYFRSNLIREALATFQTALVLAQQIKNKEMEADLLGEIGSILDFLDKYDDAIDFFSRSIKIYRKIAKNQESRGEARALYDLGLTFYHAKKLEEARSILEKASRMMKKHNDKKGDANLHAALGDIYLELGQTDIAENNYKRAQDYYQAHKIGAGIINTELGFGKVFIIKENWVQAKGKFEAALDLATKNNYLKPSASALLYLSKIAEKLGDTKEGEMYKKKANKILKDLGIKTENVEVKPETSVNKTEDFINKPEESK
jgi:tetratricopeptide (TPR) repeat protein